jgi:hypothetical protein
MKSMPQLDGIRAFAVVAVMFEHFGGEALNRFVPIGAGALGVNLFFTLSGFLITGLLLDAFTNNESKALAWRDFYVRRLLRLTPILYLAVAILALLEVRAMGSTWQWHAFYVSNFLVAAGGDKTVFWSLAVEEQFYMLWPFVIAFAPRRWLVPVCAGIRENSRVESAANEVSGGTRGNLADLPCSDPAPSPGSPAVRRTEKVRKTWWENPGSYRTANQEVTRRFTSHPGPKRPISGPSEGRGHRFESCRVRQLQER